MKVNMRLVRVSFAVVALTMAWMTSCKAFLIASRNGPLVRHRNELAAMSSKMGGGTPFGNHDNGKSFDSSTASGSTRPNRKGALSPVAKRSAEKKRKRRAAGGFGGVSQEQKKWLLQCTRRLVQSEVGSLRRNGKWHEVVSLMEAWSAYSKDEFMAPVQMEFLLKRLVAERTVNKSDNKIDMEGNIEETKQDVVVLDVRLYNLVLDAWACAALFKTHKKKGFNASQRARELLIQLQEHYEQTRDESIKPDAESFDLVLHVVCRTEGAIVARRHLAWMEHLYKSQNNLAAKPTRADYVMVLDAYANCRRPTAGKLAEGFLRHMKATGVKPDTLCYNIAIKAWTKSKRGRETAEQADVLFKEMVSSGDCTPDLVTYTSVVTAWASSGMRGHAVSRVEELLRTIEEDPNVEANTIFLNAVMSTWVKSRIPAAVQRTEEILREMESSTVAPPDLISYNTHLHALNMHAKKFPFAATRADKLLTQMEESSTSPSTNNPIHPNVFSYNVVIEAHCKSRDPDAAMRAALVLRKLVKREGVEPDSFSFDQVLAALSKSSSSNSNYARTAEELLHYMEDSYESGVHPYAKPGISSYTSVISAHGRSGQKGNAERAEQLFLHMKERSITDPSLKPTTSCYNALIDCWARSGEGVLGAQKAETLLAEMQALYEKGHDAVAPNIVTYNSVLNAWARSGTRCSGRKAERYLERMWELYQAGHEQIKPNDQSYNTVINAISKGKNEHKAQRALRVLRQMDRLYRTGQNKDARPNEITYTSVINSCAFPALSDERTRRRALDTAIFTLKELQGSRYGQPNDLTYATFLKACSNLIRPEDDSTRRTVIAGVFRECCRDGQVGELVLTYLREAAPADLFEELLADSLQQSGTTTTVTVHDLPPEWRCNIRKRGRDRQHYQEEQIPRRPAGDSNKNTRKKSTG